MAAKKLGIGIIGLGRMADIYSVAIDERGVRDLCRLVAVCDNDEQKLQSWQPREGIKAYGDYQALAQDPEIDIVFVTTPHAADPKVKDPHYDHSMAALRAKKHVLVEKPMTAFADHARQLVELAKHQGLKFTTAENTRFVPGYIEAAKRVKDGSLGEIFFVRTEIDGSSQEELQNRLNWLCKEPMGGVLLDMGVHTFYLLKWMFGGVKDIYANTYKIIPEAELEDNAVFTGRLVKGAYYVSSVSTIAKVPWTERLEIYGSKGAIIVDHLLDPPVRIYEGPDEQISMKLLEGVKFDLAVRDYEKGWKYNSIVAEVIDFVQAVAEDRPPLIDPEDGCYAVVVAEAGYESALTGKAVQVN